MSFHCFKPLWFGIVTVETRMRYDNSPVIGMMCSWLSVALEYTLLGTVAYLMWGLAKIGCQKKPSESQVLAVARWRLRVQTDCRLLIGMTPMVVYTSSNICLSLISVNSKLTLWKLCCDYGSVWESALCACVWLSGRWVVIVQPYIHSTAQSTLSLSTLNYLSLFCIHIFVLNNLLFLPCQFLHSSHYHSLPWMKRPPRICQPT